MHRRSFLALGIAAAASPALGQGQYDAALLQAVFEELPEPARERVQSELQTGGFYDSAIDGLWGPGTERALVRGAAFIAENSRGRHAFDLTRAGDVIDYMVGLTNGTLATWLYGEGEEADFG